MQIHSTFIYPRALSNPESLSLINFGASAGRSALTLAYVSKIKGMDP